MGINYEGAKNMSLYKHILLATDLSDTCGEVNRKAMEMAKAFGAKISIIHTIEPIPAYGYPGIADLESPMIDSATKEMEKVATALGIEKADRYIEFGSVKAQVLRIAEEKNVDLIVVGSHGRHGLSRLLGSSASGIVHGADCDVMTIRCK